MVNNILETCWHNWKTDKYPIDRRMAIVAEKLGTPDMSVENTRFLINEIVRRHAKEFYLEVGVWVGHSLLSAAMYNKDITCIGIEDFSMHPDKARLLRNMKRMPNNAFLMREKFQTAIPKLHKLIGKVDVYYYDGDHSHHATLLGLCMALPLMRDHSYILLDDLIMQDVRLAKDRFLATYPEWKERLCIVPDKEHGPWFNGFCVLERERQ